MAKKRRQHNAEFKAKIALEALKGIEPVHAIAAKHEIHPVQVSQWKQQLAARLPEVFARKPGHAGRRRQGARRRTVSQGRPAGDGAGLAQKKAGELER